MGVDKIGVDEMEIDEIGVDEMGVDVMGVEEMGVNPYLSVNTASPSLLSVMRRVGENKSKTFIVKDKSMIVRKKYDSMLLIWDRKRINTDVTFYGPE